MDDIRWKAVRDISAAVNFRGAVDRLLSLALERTGATGGVVLRVVQARQVVEIVAVRGGTLRPRFQHATMLHLSADKLPDKGGDEALLFFEGCGGAANFPIGLGPFAILHLEWPQGSGEEAATAEIREVCSNLGPLIEHFEKFDSRAPYYRAMARPALDLTELEQTLDHPSLERPAGALLRTLLARLKAQAGVVALARGDSLFWVAVQGVASQTPKHAEAASDPFVRVLSSGKSVSARRRAEVPAGQPFAAPPGSLLAVPLIHRGSTIGVLALAWNEEQGFEDETERTLGEVAAVAALYLRKAQLYAESLEKTPEAPLSLFGVPRDVLELADTYADTRAPILIIGETGTGKEMLARYIHRVGPRRDRPRVSLNCAEIAESLAESQIFGHMRGAFTGATSDKAGVFEQADGGTLFLDEIDRLSLAVQAKLLRVIEYGELRPVGSDKAPRTVEVKTLVATNKDLRSAVAAGRFLPDLYMRLNVCEIVLPPLRMNATVVPRVARAMLADLSRRYRKAVVDVTPRAMRLLTNYDFPGNYRELKNILEAALLSSKTQMLDLEDLGRKLPVRPATDTDPGTPADYRTSKSEFERSYLVSLMRQTRGSGTEAARLSGLSRSNLYTLLKKYSINPDDYVS